MEEDAPIFGVGVSDIVLLTVGGMGFIMLAVTTYSIIITKLKSSQELDEEERELTYEEKLANADVSNLNRAQRRARAKHIMKQQRRVAATTPHNPADGEPGEEDHDNNNQALVVVGAEDEDEVMGGGGDPSVPHLSRKERQRAAKAAEKEERKLFEEDRRRQQQEAQEEAKRKKKEKERMQSILAEEERKVRQEQRLAEEMEAYQNWKTFLSSPNGKTKLSVTEWVKELQENRDASIAALADRFGQPRAIVLSRIRELVASSRVTGVLERDDTFIYFSLDELSDIASYIKNRDVTSLGEIGKKANSIIQS